MNKKNLLILFSFVASFFSSTFSFGAAVNVKSVVFQVNNVHVVNSDKGKPSFLALDFVIYNATDTRKLDFTRSLKFLLFDEFGNHYSCLPLAGYGLTKASSEQSIYPKQSYTVPLAFELPVSKAASVTLQFDESSFDVGEEPIRIPFFLPKSENNISVRIAVPEDGITVERGKLLHLNVIVTGPRPPDGIIINALDYTYEDPSPSLDNVYDLNIPNNLAIGPQSINVIAKWKKHVAEDDYMTSSDNIIINVKDVATVSVQLTH